MREKEPRPRLPLHAPPMADIARQIEPGVVMYPSRRYKLRKKLINASCSRLRGRHIFGQFISVIIRAETCLDAANNRATPIAV